MKRDCTATDHDLLRRADISWLACTYVGTQDSGEGSVLELRNCRDCGTTVARELVPATCWQAFTQHIAACDGCVQGRAEPGLLADLCTTGRALIRQYWRSRGWEDK